MNNICCENGVFFVNELIPENKMKNLWITLIKIKFNRIFPYSKCHSTMKTSNPRGKQIRLN